MTDIIRRSRPVCKALKGRPLRKEDAQQQPRGTRAQKVVGGTQVDAQGLEVVAPQVRVPTCGYVHKDNRHGDRFHCPQCGWDGDADVVAGMNLLHRLDDPDINRWTPKIRVKAILVERFRRRKEPLLGTPLPAGL
ncbi:MAG: zinc ribbon domain-containing protein [Bacillota bacterium]